MLLELFILEFLEFFKDLNVLKLFFEYINDELIKKLFSSLLYTLRNSRNL